MAEVIPASKRRTLVDELVDLILLSKRDDKMPTSLANVILGCWQRDCLDDALGLGALLEASFLLEPEDTLKALSELRLEKISEAIEAQTAQEET